MARWLITGCSTGIGREIATAALEAGHQVVATARRPETLDDVVSEYPATARAVELDVTNEGQIVDAVQRTIDEFGGIDVLVNNAGYGYMSAVEEGEDDEIRKLFDTNFFGIVDTLRLVLPVMRQQGSGHVINISSMTGLVANPPNVFYSCTKFALEALGEGLAKEVEPFGIKVSSIEPGAFRTDWASRSMAESSSAIAEYEDVQGRKDMIRQFAEHLPGDPRKIGEAAVLLAGMDDPPLRLLMGKDVLAATREKLEAMSTSIDAWEHVTTDVDFPT
ncbi:MAG: oxidoreductase [Acidimicrobiales bacterium]|nr:oxidoreductase [Acidimicrobiales bacterium]